MEIRVALLINLYARARRGRTMRCLSKLGLAVTLYALLAAPVAAQAQTIDADWAKKPTANALKRYYPRPAAKAKVKGWAVLDCKVDTQGNLFACKIVKELPEEYGFGAAALLMAAEKNMRMKPKTVNGVPVEGQATIPVIFDVPDSWLVKMARKLSD